MNDWPGGNWHRQGGIPLQVRYFEAGLKKLVYYIGSAEGHEYPDLQVGDEVNPRPFFVLS